ncbi:2'-5'-oligoadenylate synthase 1-like [Acanthaster planci]|uniref:2'-5'-oligoadenylate synthase 1-like n=1 Tax=Acanthaster planci TaxID=133434 RepID=A0A8B7YUF8_ACAPL|nr:2'-5'-oligoadenylate synthase 1-like [Acanthaster planci]
MGNLLWSGSTECGVDSPSAQHGPWFLHPRQLETWYNDNIQLGTTEFDADCRKAVDGVVRYLHNICSTDRSLFDVSKVIKGGSLGKGTMVKDLSDVDLVAFINPPDMHSMGELTPQRYRDQLRAVLEKLEGALILLPSVKIIRRDAYLINFSIEVQSSVDQRRRVVDVDLLPTAHNIAEYASLGELFEDMLEMRGYDRGFYSASLVEHQRDFVKNQPGYVKELIRLVKYWAYTNLPPTLRKSYPLELITIHCWEEAGEPSRFYKAQGLKDVLETLCDLSQLRTYWSSYYDEALAEISIQTLRFKNPIVLDPANPTANVCWAYQREENRTMIENAALTTLQSTLLSNVEVRPKWSGW